ncbi:hypothetical protein [Trujillonella humicola]|uniref:hypothetical protein n=1 Tax=Trujillonella humicola TaxID=3383699 RepID=UPI003906C681
MAGWFAFQAAVALAGRVAARRRDRGDEDATEIRRVVTHDGLELHPRAPDLVRVDVDLAMAGAEIDLTAIPRPETPVELTARLLMAGAAVRVPPDWRVWWRFRGLGGIGSDGGVQRTSDPHTADLRIRATVLFGGIGVEAGGAA